MSPNLSQSQGSVLLEDVEAEKAYIEELKANYIRDNGSTRHSAYNQVSSEASKRKDHAGEERLFTTCKKVF